MTTQKQPLHELRIGRLTAAIWENTSSEGQTYYNVTFSKLYKKDNKWQRTDSYSRHDLLRLAKLADQADTWITEYLQADHSGQPTPEPHTDDVPY